MSDFSRISIGIKTFLRDSKLFRAIDGVRQNLPRAQMIIADDGEQTEEKDGRYAEIIREGHKVLICPWDSGFGFKSNRIVDSLDREFLLTFSDDFDSLSPSFSVGVEKMLEVLDGCPELSIVSGRLANRGPYEFHLLEENGVVTEHPTRPFLSQYYAGYVECDVTVNYSLIRRSVFDKVRWDDDVKIGGGEHGAFFLDCKRAGFKVAYVPSVEIAEQPGQDSERYKQYRRRANGSSRKCFEKRTYIKKYVLGNGQIDYERKD